MKFSFDTANTAAIAILPNARVFLKRKDHHTRAIRLRMAAAFRLRRAAMHRVEWRNAWDSLWEMVLVISIVLSSLGFVSLIVTA
jgi:hypothetical protein